MKLVVALVTACTLHSIMAQRSPYLPSKQVPGLLPQFRTTTDAGVINRQDIDAETTTALPSNLQGTLEDSKFVHRVSQWPEEKQPYWFKNRHTINSNRQQSVSGDDQQGTNSQQSRSDTGKTNTRVRQQQQQVQQQKDLEQAIRRDEWEIQKRRREEQDIRKEDAAKFLQQGTVKEDEIPLPSKDVDRSKEEKVDDFLKKDEYPGGRKEQEIRNEQGTSIDDQFTHKETHLPSKDNERSEEQKNDELPVKQEEQKIRSEDETQYPDQDTDKEKEIQLPSKDNERSEEENIDELPVKQDEQQIRNEGDTQYPDKGTIKEDEIQSKVVETPKEVKKYYITRKNRFPKIQEQVRIRNEQKRIKNEQQRIRNEQQHIRNEQYIPFPDQGTIKEDEVQLPSKDNERSEGEKIDELPVKQEEQQIRNEDDTQYTDQGTVKEDEIPLKVDEASKKVVKDDKHIKYKFPKIQEQDRIRTEQQRIRNEQQRIRNEQQHIRNEQYIPFPDQGTIKEDDVQIREEDSDLRKDTKFGKRKEDEQITQSNADSIRKHGPSRGSQREPWGHNPSDILHAKLQRKHHWQMQQTQQQDGAGVSSYMKNWNRGRNNGVRFSGGL